MTASFCIQPIGRVRLQDGRQLVEVEPAYQPALLGLEPQDRHTLQVHPCRNPANPLTGVFATRAPVRPNLMGLSAVRLLGVEGSTVLVEGLDARDGAPVLDIKPYLQKSDSLPEATGPKLWPRLAAAEG